MPPKRATKVVAKGQKRGAQGSDVGGKTKAQRTTNASAQLRQAIAEVKSEATTVRTFTPDKRLDLLIGTSKKFAVYDDYSCTLNQTNIGQNNNKFYLIQLIEVSRKVNPYVFYTRWGRVGEEGQYNLDNFNDSTQAINAFKSKFKSKTSNNWDNRSNFAAVPKKYTLLDMADDDDSDAANTTPSALTTSIASESKLGYRTAIMIKLIFSDDMFLCNMRGMNLDVKKMPLGKLSKMQIVKGLESLLDIEKAITSKKPFQELMDLSSKFYTIIPHDFGRSVPQVLCTQPIIDQKKENMMILSDIELAQSLQDKKGGAFNQLDENYAKLMCDLELIPRSSKEFKMIEKYSKASRCASTKWPTLKDIWRVNRDGETERMKAHNHIKYRKLLWHGTNIAVVAAILKAGLRIMPHSGGRVGRGIYFASEFAKSQCFMGCFLGEFENEKNIGFMFLTEVALGNTKEITDDSCYYVRAAPKGFDSIVARGLTEPDETQDLIMTYDKNEVIVPYGTPKKQAKFNTSGYMHSEYLVYNESQAKIRYLLKFVY